MPLAIRPQVIGVPPEFQDDLDYVHFTTGVPRSWIAAVCEMTGWNPYYEVHNQDAPAFSFRRIGIAGIWCLIPEVLLPRLGTSRSEILCGTAWAQPARIMAGWIPYEASACRVRAGPQVCLFQEAWAGVIDRLRPVRANMLEAANILKLCDLVVQTYCQEQNALIFLRWMWGCSFIPWDPILGVPVCTFPPGVPNPFVQETERIISAQRVYSEIFNEPVFGAPPLAISLSANMTLVGPGGSVTFSANVSGGSGGNIFTWDFGDGSPTVETANPQTSHVYETVGVYSARVTVEDRLLARAISTPLLITVEEGAPVAGFPWWAILAAGGLGAAALIAGTRKSKRQQAQEKRQRAQALRAEAAKRRSTGDTAGTARLEQEAGRLEADAQRLDQEAAREDVERAQRQMRPPGR